MSMDWSNERYVRLYTRDTVTWKRWSWEARALFALLLRKVDRSGVLDTGADEKSEALALILDVPIAVASKALGEWVAAGTVALRETALVLPSFIAAQEARQSDKMRQTESREKRAAATLRTPEVACHTVSHAVTNGHTVSQPVTPAVPSRAVPSLAVPALAPPKKPATPKVEKPTDPRHAPLKKRLADTFAAVKGFAYPFQGRDFKAVSNLLARAEPDAIDAAWGRALREATHPPIACIYELEPKLAHFMGPSPPTRGVARPVHVSNQSSTVVSEGL